MGRDKEMRERNIYKDIVICIVVGGIVFFLYGQLQSYRREQKAYGFSIQSSRDLTQETVDELQKISGIYRFEPEEAVIITIKIGEYTMETEVFGVDLQDFPGKWKEGLETFSLRNTPVLFWGTDSFQGFTDRNGYGLGKSQADKWKQDYPNLNLTLEDDAGKERDGKICGILEEPKDKIFMDKKQMEEIFGKSVHIRGGRMEIFGYQNAKKAKELLEQGGFTVEKIKL